jgi:regulator of sigma E protease
MKSAWLKFAAVLAGVVVLGGPWGLAILGGILLVVLGHEIGHLLAAKATGCVASDLSVGFGPVVLQRRGHKRWYRLRAYPLGGFVKLEPEDGIEGPAMTELSPPRRFLIAVAGPLGSFASAFLLLAVLFAGTGINLPGTAVEGDGAGLRRGDVLLAVNGDPVSNGAALYQAGDVTVVVFRDGREVAVLIPETEKLAVRLDSTRRRIPVAESLPLAAEVTGEAVVTSVRSVAAVPGSLWRAMNPETAQDTKERPVSLIGVMQGGSEFSASFGTSGVIFLIAQISVVLGVFNLLPFPPLDGGHALVAAAEGIGSRLRRRTVRIPEALVARVSGVAMVLLLVFSATVMILDLLFPVF